MDYPQDHHHHRNNSVIIITIITTVITITIIATTITIIATVEITAPPFLVPQGGRAQLVGQPQRRASNYPMHARCC